MPPVLKAAEQGIFRKCFSGFAGLAWQIGVTKELEVVRTLCIAMALSMLAIPLHGLAQSEPAPAASSGAIIMPPATDSGMVKEPPRNVDPGGVSKPPASIDPEMIQKPGQTPEQKPGAPDMPSRSAPLGGNARPGTDSRQPHPGMRRNENQNERYAHPRDDCRGNPEACTPHAAPDNK